MASRRTSALVALALAALNAAAVLALGRVFASGSFLLPLLGAIALAHAIGYAARDRGFSATATVAASIAVLAAYVVWTRLPETTAYGLPTASTVSTLGHQLSSGYHELRTAVVPAPVTDGAVLLALLAAFAMATVADLVAFRRHATAGAAAPALAMFIWAATLGGDELRLRTTVGFAAAALVFLLVQQQAVLERGRARFVGRRIGTGSGVLSLGVIVGAAAVLGGLVLGPALPGAGDRPLLDVRGPGPRGRGDGNDRSYRTEPPLARIGDNFTRRGSAELFTVRASKPEYWRIAALDTYTNDNGGEWTLTAEGSDEVTEGLHEPVRGRSLQQDYRIGVLDGRWMPAAYEPRRVEGGAPLVVRASTTLVTGRANVQGLSYSVTSRLTPSSDQPPTPEQREATARPVPKDFGRFTRLPADFPTDVRDQARRITAGATTPFDQAAALEQFFLDPSSGFQYSLDVDLSASAQSETAIQEFLQRRVGFCVQFAGSYAAMARSIGLPARVAVGYTPGKLDPNRDAYAVTTDDAHAWPEVWLAGLGWTRFEPTPPSDLPGASDLPGRAPAAPTAPTTAQSPTSAPTASTAPTPRPSPPSRARTRVAIDAPGRAAPRHDRGFAPDWRVLAALPLVAMLLAIGAAVAIVIAKRRRRRRRRARDEPAAVIAGAWEELLDRLDEAGFDRSAARTPLELATDAPARLPADATTPLRELAATYSETCYGPRAATGDAAEQAWRDADAIRMALAAAASVRERWRRRFDPAPLRR